MSAEAPPTVRFVDNSIAIPESVFPAGKPVAVAFFIQDAKIDFSKLRRLDPDSVKTCEFGTVACSQWGLDVWGQGRSRPLERAIKVLNDENVKVWLMAKPDTVAEMHQSEGEHDVWFKMQKALETNSMNILPRADLLHLQSFPSRYKESGFRANKLSCYYAIGMTPYVDADVEAMADITKQYRQVPRVIMMDGGLVGPVNRIMGYKHLTRLAMNGTDAAVQNPDYVMVESRYQETLASFLKTRFPQETRLVLKQVAASRGEGVVILDATSVEKLDQDLKKHLATDSEFKKTSLYSVCLVEKFISTPEEGSETVVRVVYLAVQQMGELKLHALDAVKATEDTSSHGDSSTQGMVKLGKWYREIKLVEDDDLKKIEQVAEKSISAIAQRAMRYDSSAAVRYFLTSDNPILNLVGVELFYPYNVCIYRVEKKITEEQCELLSNLLDRNQSPLLLERMYENIILDLFKSVTENVIPCKKYPDLLLKLLQLRAPSEKDKIRLSKFISAVTGKKNSVFSFAVLIQCVRGSCAKQ